MKKIFAIILIFGLITGCTTDTKTKKKANKGKKTQMAKKNSPKAKKGTPNKKGGSSDYWTSLQKHLKVSDAKITQLKNLNAAYEKSKGKLPKKDGKIDKAALTKWQGQKNTAIKKNLGDALFAKKVAFDKKRQAAAAAKKKK